MDLATNGPGIELLRETEPGANERCIRRTANRRTEGKKREKGKQALVCRKMSQPMDLLLVPDAPLEEVPHLGRQKSRYGADMPNPTSTGVASFALGDQQMRCTYLS